MLSIEIMQTLFHNLKHVEAVLIVIILLLFLVLKELLAIVLVAIKRGSKI